MQTTGQAECKWVVKSMQLRKGSDSRDTAYAEPSLEEQLMSQDGGMAFDFDDEPSLAEQLATQADLHAVGTGSQMQHDEEPEMQI